MPKQAQTLPLESSSIYNELPYPALCFAQSHPDRLATIATLLGMQPTPVPQARVLELGCAVGGNLIPMAYTLPAAQFIGVDYAPAQIAVGQAVANDLGLMNLELRAADIRDITSAWGEFDYIIAHGVYSWVPPEVAEAILRVCHENLAAQGVAYISYNTYPGWAMLGAMRQMMLYHTRDVAPSLEKATRAVELVSFLSEAMARDESAYAAFLRSYGEMLFERQEESSQRGNALLLHDELELDNHPVYFHEFAERAARHGLQYLAEARFPMVMPNEFDAATVKRLQEMAGSVVEIEQYMDFLRNRSFRQTLLCRAEVQLQRNLRPDPEQMRAFYVASRGQPVETDLDLIGSSVLHFETAEGAKIATDHPVSKAALFLLAQTSPASISFDNLLTQARQLVYGDDQDAKRDPRDALVLAANLLRGFTYSLQLVELKSHRPEMTTRASAHPTVSAYARWQAAHGEERVTNLRHERVVLDPVSRYLLPYLDGSRNRDALLELLLMLLSEGKLFVQGKHGLITDPESARAEMSQELERSLEWLALAGLFVA